MRPHGSFSDFVRKSSCPCAAARPRRIEVAASSVHASQRDASESRSFPHDPHHIPQLLHHLRRKQAKGTWSSTLASMPPKQRPNWPKVMSSRNQKFDVCGCDCVRRITSLGLWVHGLASVHVA